MKLRPEDHRTLNTILILGLFIVLVTVVFAFQHNIEDCETRLFEKLTNMKAPDLKAQK